MYHLEKQRSLSFQVDMITEMDNLVNPGSDLVIAAALPEAEMQRRLYAGGIATSPCARQDCFACKGRFMFVLMCF
jgi:hypothetical protein